MEVRWRTGDGGMEMKSLWVVFLLTLVLVGCATPILRENLFPSSSEFLILREGICRTAIVESRFTIDGEPLLLLRDMDRIECPQEELQNYIEDIP